MSRLAALATLTALAALCGCGGTSTVTSTTADPEAVKREQERLRAPLPGGSGKPLGAANR